MIAIAAAIVEQQRWVSVVCVYDIHAAVAIEIGEADSAAHIGRLKAAARQLGSFDKLAVAFVVEQHISLLIVNFRCSLFDLRIDMSIGDENVLPTIVIVIEEASTESKHSMHCPCDSRLIGNISEKSRTLVMPEMVRG